jgi:hypothetical protein
MDNNRAGLELCVDGSMHASTCTRSEVHGNADRCATGCRILIGNTGAAGV